MMDNILFYILVPVYKVESYIDECIRSVLTQTNQNFRLILVDDGSPDKSGEICDQYAKVDSRITVLHQQNQGQMSARCAAIRFVKEHFKTEGHCIFFIFLDSDDFLEPFALSSCALHINQTHCDMVIYGVNPVPQKRKTDEKYIGSITDKRSLYRLVFFNYAYNSLCRKAVRCDLVGDEDFSRFYAIRHGEDLLQSIPIYCNCGKATFIPERLYNYRVNPSSITHTVDYNNFQIDTTVRETAWAFLEKEAVFNEQDWTEYTEYCLSLMRKKIQMIAGFQIKLSEKKQRWGKLRENPYYAMLLARYRGKNPVIFALRRGWYNALYVYYQFAKAVLSLKHKVSG